MNVGDIIHYGKKGSGRYCKIQYITKENRAYGFWKDSIAEAKNSRLLSINTETENEKIINNNIIEYGYMHTHSCELDIVGKMDWKSKLEASL